MLPVGNSGALPTICRKGFSKAAQNRNIAKASSAAFFNNVIYNTFRDFCVTERKKSWGKISKQTNK